MSEWQNLPTMSDVGAAQLEGWEIEWSANGAFWYPWKGKAWIRAQAYRARPRPPKTKKVKMLCWFINGHLNWLQEGNHAAGPDWRRVPPEDKEIEVEDD